MLLAEDDRPDSPATTVVSYRYWTQSLGSDPQIAGKKLLINGSPFTVVGVTPPEFYGVRLNNLNDFWFPLNQQSLLMDRSNWLKTENEVLTPELLLSRCSSLDGTLCNLQTEAQFFEVAIQQGTAAAA